VNENRIQLYYGMVKIYALLVFVCFLLIDCNSFEEKSDLDCTPCIDWNACVLKDQIEYRIQILSRISESNQVLSRSYLSESDHQASLLVQEWMNTAGMSVSIDFVGNIIGLWSSSTLKTHESKSECCALSKESSCETDQDKKTLVLGSHIDTVWNAGKYDGTLGVLVSIAVVSMIQKNSISIPFDIAVIAFADEEGNNQFGTTNTGAKAFCGLLNPISDFLNTYPELYKVLASQLKLENRSFTQADVIQAIQECTSDAFVSSKSSMLGFIEVHIEQGPQLELMNRPIAAVKSIYGQSRLRVSVVGVGGHAGTVPMKARRDALAAAAECILKIEQIGLEYWENGVATVGKIEIVGGSSSNVIAGHVEFSVDVRHSEDSDRLEMVSQLYKETQAIGNHRNVSVSITMLHEAPAAQMTPWLVDIVQKSVREHRENGDVDSMMLLNSGAGHDAMILSQVMPTAMLFVRCRGGISHHPDEYVSLNDIYTVSSTLLSVIQSKDLANAAIKQV